MVDDSQAKTSAHAVLAAVLQVRAGRLQALLWQRAREPFASCWALPGGALAADETLEQSMLRHLAEKVDVRDVAHLEQLETRSDPSRNPTRRELATAFLGLVPSGVDPQVPEDTQWHPLDELPELAYDHEEILLSARERLRGKLSYTNLSFALAPPSLARLPVRAPGRGRDSRGHRADAEDPRRGSPRCGLGDSGGGDRRHPVTLVRPRRAWRDRAHARAGRRRGVHPARPHSRRGRNLHHALRLNRRRSLRAPFAPRAL